MQLPFKTESSNPTSSNIDNMSNPPEALMFGIPLASVAGQTVIKYQPCGKPRTLLETLFATVRLSTDRLKTKQTIKKNDRTFLTLQINKLKVRCQHDNH